MNALFLKVGGPSRGERVSKVNRLLAIEEALQGCGGVAAGVEFVFPKIEVPPAPEPEEGEAEVPEVKESPKKK